jgi:hypothetical protein
VLQEVEKWITGPVQDTTFGYLNFNALVRVVLEEDIAEKVASWNCEIDLEEPCPGINKENVAAWVLKQQSVRRCASQLCRRCWGNIVNVTDIEDIKATAMEIILKKRRGDLK